MELRSIYIEEWDKTILDCVVEDDKTIGTFTYGVYGELSKDEIKELNRFMIDMAQDNRHDK